MQLFVLGLFLVNCVNGAPINHEWNDECAYGEVLGESGEYFEGDMILTAEQQYAITEATESRNGLRDLSKRWPDRTVVYYIEEEDFDEDRVKLIEAALEDISNNSCITFQRRENNEHAVIIQGSESGCFSHVGFISQNEESEARQVLNLASGCFRHGTIVHEMLHTLGFYHMQSTYDRDDYVTIVWENIRPGMEHNFAKYTNDTVTDFGVPYDYESVMHYSETSFSVNGNRTIVPLQDDAKIGQRIGMSNSDILKLKKMYCEEEETKEDQLDITQRRLTTK